MRLQLLLLTHPSRDLCLLHVVSMYARESKYGDGTMYWVDTRIFGQLKQLGNNRFSLNIALPEP